jgi:uncharacterized damage-inducible protein DinB
MNDIGRAFITRSRYHLAEDFLPKLEQCLAKLTDEQIWWRPNEQSNSIGNLVLHLCGNARQWIVCGVGGATDGRDRDAEFAQREIVPRDRLLSLLNQTIKDVDATLAAYEPERLLEMRTIQGTQTSALDAMLHVVEHFSMHTGQIIMMTKILTGSDMAFYDFVNSKPILKWKSEASS